MNEVKYQKEEEIRKQAAVKETTRSTIDPQSWSLSEKHLKAIRFSGAQFIRSSWLLSMAASKKDIYNNFMSLLTKRKKHKIKEN